MFWRRPRRRRGRRDALAGVATSLDRLRGCLLGGALGDAAGAAHEGRARALVRRRAPLRLTSITDDTQLTLATCLAIADEGRDAPEVIAASLVAWGASRGYRGLGSATAKALRELERGGHWALVGRKGEMAAGDGAAVRVAPLAFIADPRGRRARIRDIARITHHNDEAYTGALAIAIAVHDAAVHDRRPSLPSIAASLPDTNVRDRLLALTKCSSIAEAASRHGCSGWVAEAVPLALFAASCATSDGFETMLAELVAAGGDCDSIAAMAGQCWGALHGAAKLPRALLESLQARAEIDAIARRVASRLGLALDAPSR